MIDFIQDHKIDILLVEKTDRLYRNFKDHILIDELIQAAGIEIHLVKENEVLGKNASSHTKFIHGIKLLMAKNYIDNLSEEIKKGQFQRAKEGHLPTLAPLGYLNQNRVIVINHERSQMVMRIFKLYATGDYSLEKLKNQLYKEGFLYRPSEPKIPTITLGKILRNKFYIGLIEWGDNVYQGKHQSLIDVTTFEKCQAILNKGNSRGTNNNFAYNNLIKCSCCDAQIVGEMKKQKYIYYHCGFKKKTLTGEKCINRKYLSESDLEKQIIKNLREITLSKDVKEVVKRILKEINEEKNQYYNDRIKKLETQLTKIKSKQEALYYDKLENIITMDFFKAQNQKLSEQIIMTQKLLEKENNCDLNFYEKAELLLELLENFAERFFSFSSERKRNFLKLFYSNLTLENGKVEFTLNSTFEIVRILNFDKELEARRLELLTSCVQGRRSTN